MRSDELALHRGGAKGRLPHAAAGRHLDLVFDGAAQRALAFCHRVHIAHAVRGVVKGIAFGGNPGHLGRFGQQQFIVVHAKHAMLAVKALQQLRQQTQRLRQRQCAVACELLEVSHVLRAQRVARGRQHARNGRLEGCGELLGVQLRHKELCDLFREITVAVGAARHLQAWQRVGALQLKTQWAQHTGKGCLARWQRAAGPAHRAQCAMVKHHLPLLRHHVAGDVVLPGRHALNQAMKQRHVQGLGQLRAGDRTRGGLLQRWMNVHLLMDGFNGFGWQAAGEELLEMGHFRRVIGR